MLMMQLRRLPLLLLSCLFQHQLMMQLLKILWQLLLLLLLWRWKLLR